MSVGIEPNSIKSYHLAAVMLLIGAEGSPASATMVASQSVAWTRFVERVPLAGEAARAEDHTTAGTLTPPSHRSRVCRDPPDVSFSWCVWMVQIVLFSVTILEEPCCACDFAWWVRWVACGIDSTAVLISCP